MEKTALCVLFFACGRSELKPSVGYSFRKERGHSFDMIFFFFFFGRKIVIHLGGLEPTCGSWTSLRLWNNRNSCPSPLGVRRSPVFPSHRSQLQPEPAGCLDMAVGLGRRLRMRSSCARQPRRPRSPKETVASS